MSQRSTSALAILFSFSSAAYAAAMPDAGRADHRRQELSGHRCTTGHEMASLDPDDPLAPASLTKIMTTYVVFSACKQGQITLEDEVTVSEKAWRTEGSRMFIEVGTRVT